MADDTASDRQRPGESGAVEGRKETGEELQQLATWQELVRLFGELRGAYAELIVLLKKTPPIMSAWDWQIYEAQEAEAKRISAEIAKLFPSVIR